MRLTFTILWFENQIDEVRAAISGLRDHLAEAGFELDVRVAADGSGIDEFAREQDRYHDIDLIVVDLDLGQSSEDGDAIAQKVRRRFKFTDIVFYSGVAPNELRHRINEREIDGVYCMARSELRHNLIELVDDLVRRMSRLDSMRGLAVATAGRCDAMLRDAIAALHDRADAAGRADLLGFLDKEVEASGARIAKGYSRTKALSEKLESHACSSMVLLKLAKRLLDGDADLKDLRKVLGRYQAEVMEIRNDLGHAVEARRPDGWIIECRGGRSIAREDFPAIRQDLLRHLANLAELCARLGVEGCNNPEQRGT